MSRRTADEEISAGKVTVNGKPAVLGQKIDPEDDVVIYIKESPSAARLKKYA